LYFKRFSRRLSAECLRGRPVRQTNVADFSSFSIVHCLSENKAELS